MLTLGIETSCDETSVSVTEGRRVLSNIVSSSVHLHKRYGGVVPEIASRFHVEYIVEVLSKALKRSGRTLKEIRLVAVTNGPGLVGALLTGISLAKAISYGLDLPLIGVNHILAHLYSAFLNEREAPEFPFVGLVVSGGHTALFLCETIDRRRLLGQTQDDAVGEAYDKVAKILQLGYPGGPVIERKARLSRKRDKSIFPRIFTGKDLLDFSFSGIKTAVLYYVRGTHSAAPKRLTKGMVSDICYAFQESVIDSLAEKAFSAVKVTGARTLVVGGGVAANARLKARFYEQARFSGGELRIRFPEMLYSMDNAAMIAALGEALYKKGHRSDLGLNAEPNLGIQ